jgi:hypothetical protein
MTYGHCRALIRIKGAPDAAHPLREFPPQLKKPFGADPL